MALLNATDVEAFGKRLVSIWPQMRSFSATEESATQTKQTKVDQCEVGVNSPNRRQLNVRVCREANATSRSPTRTSCCLAASALKAASPQHQKTWRGCRESRSDSSDSARDRGLSLGSIVMWRCANAN